MWSSAAMEMSSVMARRWRGTPARVIASALDISAETLLAQAGPFDDTPPPEGDERHETEAAIRVDSRLNDEQKEALLAVYRGFLRTNT